MCECAVEYRVLMRAQNPNLCTPRAKCASSSFKRDCTGLVEVVCTGGFGVRDSLRATPSWCGGMRTQLYFVELRVVYEYYISKKS